MKISKLAPKCVEKMKTESIEQIKYLISKFKAEIKKTERVIPVLKQLQKIHGAGYQGAIEHYGQGRANKKYFVRKLEKYLEEGI